MRRHIEFTHSGSSAIVGNFAAGDRLTCAADLADHFVHDAGCAKFLDAEVAAAPAPAPAAGPTAEPAAEPKKRRRQAD